MGARDCKYIALVAIGSAHQSRLGPTAQPIDPVTVAVEGRDDASLARVAAIGRC